MGFSRRSARNTAMAMSGDGRYPAPASRAEASSAEANMGDI
jgi:hypothetical protein